MSHVLDIVAPGNAFSSWVRVAKGECPAPLNNQNPWLREANPWLKNPGPPGWGLGVALITSPYKIKLIMETANLNETGYIGCSTTTCWTSDDDFITWVDGSMTIVGESRKWVRGLTESSDNSKTMVKVGCWNVRKIVALFSLRRQINYFLCGSWSRGPLLFLICLGGLKDLCSQGNFPLFNVVQ